MAITIFAVTVICHLIPGMTKRVSFLVQSDIVIDPLVAGVSLIKVDNRRHSPLLTEQESRFIIKSRIATEILVLHLRT